MNDLDPTPMTPAERDAAWRSILTQLEPAPRSRVRLIAVPVALAGAATAAIALVPASTPNRPTPLGSASAAQVLRAAAAASDLGAPGPGQVLFEQERRVLPVGDGQPDSSYSDRTWTEPDGTGRRVSVYRYPGARPTTTRDRFPGGDADPEWAGALTAAQVAALPTDPDALRDDLRAAIRRTSGGDDELKVIGPDLAVLGLDVELSETAPLSADQRGALLELLATAPQWTTPGTSITPMSVRNLGAATDADGRDGIRIRVELRFTAAEARELSIDPEPFALDFVIDPDRGRILEVREFEDGLDGRPQVTTIERQEIRPA